MARAGNNHKGGRPKGSLASHTIQIQEAKKRLIEKYVESQDAIVTALLEKAKTGDIPAIKETFDRVYGKAMQAVEMTGKDGEKLFEPNEKIKQLADDILHKQRDSRGN